MPELTLGDGLALQRLDDLGIGLSVDNQLLKAAFVDRREAAGQRGLLGECGHSNLPAFLLDTERSVALQKACHCRAATKPARYQ